MTIYLIYYIYDCFAYPAHLPLQAFHTLYHTDEPVLLGAPTGSGKTISAELTMMRIFSEHPGQHAGSVSTALDLAGCMLTTYGCMTAAMHCSAQQDIYTVLCIRHDCPVFVQNLNVKCCKDQTSRYLGMLRCIVPAAQ